MIRTIGAYILLIFLPSMVLAVLAYRMAERDHDDRMRAYHESVGAEADALARRFESALDDAAQKARTVFNDVDDALVQGNGIRVDEVVGFARQGGWAGYSPVEHEVDSSATDKELALFQMSLEGGESYELEHRDFDGAIDAYSFFLARIHCKDLRDRLRFRVARAALAGERVDLGVKILEELFNDAGESFSVEGFPVDLLAARLLLERQREDGLPLRLRVRERLEDAARVISTAFLESFAAVLRDPVHEDPSGASGLGPRLDHLVEQRRSLEEAIANHPETLRTLEAVLTPSTILVARNVGTESGALRALCEVGVSLPDLDAGVFEARVLSSRDITNGVGVTRDIHLGADGPKMAVIEVGDPQREDKFATFARQRLLQRTLVVFMILMSLGGGAALTLYVLRERHLARLRVRLLANVSHELKTPITSIRMFSEMLAEDPLDDGRTRRFGKLLFVESLRLSRILENVLDFSRLGRRDEFVTLEPVDIGALLERIAWGFSMRATEKYVSFRADGLDLEDDRGETLMIESNDQAVERIVVNLLDNALKYRGKNDPSIRLAASVDEGKLRVEVADNGVGIPKRDRDRIFEELYRVRYQDYGVKGAGLGLSISRRLARKLNGDLTLESSDEGVGSVFGLTLPLGSREERQKEPPEESQSSVTEEVA
jgi:signal transduction histidine kinase